MSNRSVVVSIAVCAVLCLMTGTATANGCTSVEMIITGVGDVWVKDPACMGYYYCQVAYVEGDLGAGEYWAYWNVNDVHYWPPKRGTTVAAVAVYLQPDGELQTQELGVVHWGAGPYAATQLITGGSGDYEGAEGWLLVYIDFFEAGTGSITGKLCLP